VNAYPAPGDLLPWITRHPDGRWTGSEFPTREAALQAGGPGVTVWPDNYVLGHQPNLTTHAPRQPVTPAWERRG
jgi:hypothetical protein